MNKADKATLKLEIRARKEVMKRLDYPKQQLIKRIEKEKADRAKILEGDYKTYDEAQEAYGMGVITESQFDQIAEALEDGLNFIENTQTAASLALEILNDWIIGCQFEINSFELELRETQKKNGVVLE